MNENTPDDKSHDREDRENDDDRPFQTLKSQTERIGRVAVGDRPNARTDDVGNQEVAPAKRPATVRSTGTNCATKTILPPWRKNKYWPSLILLGDIRT